jgi:small multidrug resistance pump
VSNIINVTKYLRVNMGYFYLLIAIIGEVVGTISLKSTNNFSEFLPSTYVVLGYGIAFYFMMLAMKTIPVAITYSIWAGVGISAITILGALKYNEIPDILALCGIALVIVGVIILVFYSKMGAS